MDDLEKERVKLLERLRKQADLATGDGTFYGLTNEECDSVFELIEHIRYVGFQFNYYGNDTLNEWMYWRLHRY